MSDYLKYFDLEEQQIHELYPSIVGAVMEYILQQKERSPDTPLLDIIADFCVKKKCPVEVVGDAIASDTYFKSFIETDCEFHNIIRSKKKKLDDW